MIYFSDARMYVNPANVTEIHVQVQDKGWYIFTISDPEGFSTMDAEAVNLLIKAVNHYLGATKVENK